MRRLVAALAIWGLLILAGAAWSASPTLLNAPEQIKADAVPTQAMDLMTPQAADSPGLWQALPHNMALLEFGISAERCCREPSK